MVELDADHRDRFAKLRGDQRCLRRRKIPRIDGDPHPVAIDAHFGRHRHDRPLRELAQDAQEGLRLRAGVDTKAMHSGRDPRGADDHLFGCLVGDVGG